MSDHHLSRQPVARAYAAMLRVLGFVGAEDKKGPPEIASIANVRVIICHTCGHAFDAPIQRGRPPVRCVRCRNGGAK